MFYILLSLTEPCHGYGIMQQIEEMSNGVVTMGAGTLYGAIRKLQSRGWIQEAPSEDTRRKNYVLTNRGHQVVSEELRRLEALVSQAQQILHKKEESK